MIAVHTSGFAGQIYFFLWVTLKNSTHGLHAHPFKFSVSIMVSIAMKRYLDYCNSYKGKHLTKVAADNFRDLVHYQHGGEHDSCDYSGMQADMVLELRILHLDLKAAGNELFHRAWLEHLKDLKAHFTVSFLQKTTPTSTSPHLLKVPVPLGTFSFKAPQLLFIDYCFLSTCPSRTLSQLNPLRQCLLCLPFGSSSSMGIVPTHNGHPLNADQLNN